MSDVEWRPAWVAYSSDAARRGRTNDAITALEREGRMAAHVARFLRHVLDFANERGGVRTGADTLGEAMRRCRERVLALEAIACSEGWLQRIRKGGGAHRTNRFLFKIGVWRDDPRDPHQQRHFSERMKAENAAGDEAEREIFLRHRRTGECNCWKYAPRELHHTPPDEQVAIDWHLV